MLTTGAALFIKMIPYVLAMRVATGVIDIGVHTVKCRIGKIK